MSEYSPIFEKAHPRAKELLNDAFFFDNTDETAPFGNDDGADTYAGFKDWRKEHINEDPIGFLIEQVDYCGYPKFDIFETDLLAFLALAVLITSSITNFLSYKERWVNLG